MREIARRFNHLYGKEKGFEEKAQDAVKKLGSKRANKLYNELRTEFQQRTSVPSSIWTICRWCGGCCRRLRLCAQTGALAQDTMRDVREVMGLGYA